METYYLYYNSEEMWFVISVERDETFGCLMESSTDLEWLRQRRDEQIEAMQTEESLTY